MKSSLDAAETRSWGEEEKEEKEASRQQGDTLHASHSIIPAGNSKTHYMSLIPFVHVACCPAPLCVDAGGCAGMGRDLLLLRESKGSCVQSCGSYAGLYA